MLLGHQQNLLGLASAAAEEATVIAAIAAVSASPYAVAAWDTEGRVVTCGCWAHKSISVAVCRSVRGKKGRGRG